MKPHCALSKFDFSYTRDSMKLQAGLGQLEALLSVLDVGLQRPFSCVCFVVVVIWLVGWLLLLLLLLLLLRLIYYLLLAR